MGVLAVLAFVATLQVTGPQFTWDARDYAQMGREWARGHGFSTEVLGVFSIPEVLRHGNLAGRWPIVGRPHLPAMFSGMFFRRFGANDRTAVLWSGMFYVATAALMYPAWLGLFGETIALISALVFAGSRCGVGYARSGLTESAAREKDCRTRST